MANIITRQDYLEKRATNAEYYAQFVNTLVLNRVLSRLGKERLAASTDENFNDIPLAEWDAVLIPAESANLMRECGDYLTKAGSVCIAKQAAREIISGTK